MMPKKITWQLLLLFLLSTGFTAPAQQGQGLPVKNSSLQFTFRTFDYEYYNSLTGKKTVALADLPQNGEVSWNGSTWKITVSQQQLPAGLAASDLQVRFELLQGELQAANVAVEMLASNWSASNYLLMPAGAYKGNRFRSRRVRYSPKLMDPRDIGPDKPQVVTDIPRLNIGQGPSRIQDRSGSLGRPAIGYWSAEQQRAVWLLAQQRNSYGDLGLAVEENRDRSQATFSISAPLVRQRNIYHITNYDVPSPDRAADFKPGDVVEFRLRLYEFDAPELQGLFDRYADIRGELLPQPVFDPLLPFSAAMAIQEKKFNRDNWVEDVGYYAIGMRENFLQDWQIGWTGGMISSYPLLFAGNKQTRERVKRMLDWLLPNGISPAGFFYDSGEGGDKWYGGDIRYPHTRNWHLVRKGSDGLYYVLQQFMLLKEQGETVKTRWEEPVKGVADAFVKIWNENGQLGQFLHSETGEIMVGGSSSGAVLPAALLLCAEYYNEPAYAEKAAEIGEYFYRNFTSKGLTTGGPGDAMQNPDSESSYGLVESYIALYEATGKQKWKQYAAEAARQFSTWVLAYDYQFPEESCFGRMNMHSTGAVFANTQNRHAAPNICTHSGWGLMRIYRATTDTFFLDLLHEIAFNSPQYLSTEDRPVCGMRPGWMNERVQTTDWETTPIGEIFKGSTWAETANMLMTVQVPGLYIDPEAGIYRIMDNIEGELLANRKRSMSFRLKNPAAYPARVKVFVDKDKTAALSPHYLYQCEEVEIPAGGEVLYRVKKQ